MKKEHNSTAVSLRQKAEELHKQGKLKKSSSLLPTPRTGLASPVANGGKL